MYLKILQLLFVYFCGSSSGQNISEGANGGNQSYILTVPKVLLVGEESTICLTLNNVEFDLFLKIDLTASKRGAVLFSANASFPNGDGGCFPLHLPRGMTDVPKVHLHVEGSTTPAGYHFVAHQRLALKYDFYLTLIQTDKPVYKPGHEVKFRIFTIKPDFRPLTDIISKVWVEDAGGTRVAQWTDVDNDQGLASLQLLLSNEPVLGLWKIKANISSSITVQTFIVKEYVLPKFEVTIIAPSFVMADADSLRVKVCALYTYGKHVRGILRVTAVVDLHKTYQISLLSDTNTQILKGCYVMTLPLTDVHSHLLRVSQYVYSAKVLINATVEEHGTGAVINAVPQTTRLLNSFLNIHFDKHYKYYKPGLPFYGKLLVTNPDDVPVADEVITIEFHDMHSEQVCMTNFTTDSSGQIIFYFPCPSMHTNDFEINWIMASSPSDGDERERRQRRLVSRAKPAYLWLDRWVSASQNLVQMDPISTKLQCNKSAIINVRYTTPQHSNYRFQFQLMARGNIVWSKSETHTFNGSEDDMQPKTTYVTAFEVEVPVEYKMSPLCKLLVFFIRPDGEVVADSMELRIERCLKNQVELQLSDSERLRPGESTSMLLKAAPGSLCSVAVVDKSVHLLQGGQHKKMLSKLFAKVRELTLSATSEQRCDGKPPSRFMPPVNSYYQSLRAFHVRNIMFKHIF